MKLLKSLALIAALAIPVLGAPAAALADAPTCGAWPDPLHDCTEATVAISSATTTKVISNTPGLRTFIYLQYAVTTGVNTAATAKWVRGNGANCGSNQSGIGNPQPMTLGGAALDFTTEWGSAAGTPSAAANTPAALSVAQIIPAGFDVCVTTAGTVLINNYAYYGQTL